MTMKNVYDIPLEIAAISRHLAPHLAPHTRAGAFTKQNRQPRENESYTNLLVSLLVFDILANQGIICQLELVARVDHCLDLSLRHRGQYVTAHIKSSTSAPYRDDLHLFIKQEEIAKPVDIYMQVFVHDFSEDHHGSPHVHIPGWLTRNGPQWKRHVGRIQDIPGCVDQRGLAIPLSELRPLKSLLDIVDHAPGRRGNDKGA